MDLLTVAEAHQLLARRISPGRLAAEPAAAEKIIAHCARLPLALSIVAARAATHPRFALGALAGELAHKRGRLDAFDDTEGTADVRAVFSWSYQQLSPEAKRLFRLLGLHPGPHSAVAAAASLAGLSPSRARSLHAALAAAIDLHLRVEPIAVSPPADGVASAQTWREAEAPDSMTDGRDADIVPCHAAAWAWFENEHPVLVAVIQLAAAAGYATHAWQLAWTLMEYFDRWGYWHHLIATQPTPPAHGDDQARAGPPASRSVRRLRAEWTWYTPVLKATTRFTEIVLL